MIVLLFGAAFVCGPVYAQTKEKSAASTAKTQKKQASSTKKATSAKKQAAQKKQLKPMAERKKAAAALRKKTPAAQAASPVYADRYASIVVDARTGAVISEVSGDRIRYPASLTKMMTVYLAFDAVKQGRLTFSQKVPVSHHAAAQPALDLGLIAGEYVSVGDLISAIVVRSANDAAVALAEAVGGSEEAFARQMTRKARALGMSQTTFTNASGLPDMQQVTTARDMARLGIALRRDFPDYYHYFGKRSMAWKGRTINSHNRVTLNYPGADGLKTGFIRASGFNLVTSARRGKTVLVGVVMGGRSAHSRDEHMVSLLDRAFAAIESNTAPMTASVAMSQPVAATPQAQPASVAFTPPARPSGGKWAIQVGAYTNPKDAMIAATHATQLVPVHLQHSKIEITPDGPAHNAIHRARLTQLSEVQARSACTALIQKRESCFVLNLDS